MSYINEILPDYSSLDNEIPLPAYCNLKKKFIVKNIFSFLTIPKSKWNIQEKETNLNWFKVQPNERGIQLKEFNKQVLLETKLIPSNNEGLKFQILTPYCSLPVAEIITCDKTCFEIIIFNPTLKGVNIKKYTLKKVKHYGHLFSSYKLVYNDFSHNILASLELRCKGSNLGEFRFSTCLLPFEFHIFLVAFTQILSHIYS